MSLTRIASALERIADFFEWQRAVQEEARRHSEEVRRQIEEQAALAEKVREAMPVVPDPTAEAMQLISKMARKVIGDD